MRILVISDIHSNLTALKAVLRDVSGFDTVWCLGDLVGYGPDPNECIELIAQLPNLHCVIGNHDAAVIETLDTNTFNNDAKLAIQWTKSILSKQSLEFLFALPESRIMDLVTIVHGSPQHPVWEYIMDIYTAAKNFQNFSTTYCFVGHTHFPAIFHQIDQKILPNLYLPEIGKAFITPIRSILNPGSVGQPRDRDPRASYAIFQPQEQLWEFRRVTYDYKTVQERMIKVGLPEKHIQRLAGGW